MTRDLCPTCGFDVDDGWEGEPCPLGSHKVKVAIGWLHELPECGVGGPLHIVTDDANIDDHHLDYCAAEVAAGTHWSMQGSVWANEIAMLSNYIIEGLRPLTPHARHATVRGW